MNIKKRSNVVLITLLFLLVIPLASAGFWDWISKLGEITGMAESVTTTLNISVGNQVPRVFEISICGGTSFDPTEADVTAINFSFLADDQDGIAQLVNATANITVTLKDASIWDNMQINSTDTSLSGGGGCEGADTGNNATVQNYTCGILLRYWDRAASSNWNVTAQVCDATTCDFYDEAAAAPTFTYTSLTAINMTPTALGWPAVTSLQADIGSSDDPLIIGNRGNYNISDNKVNVTAIDLHGETTTSEMIPAGNFTVNTADAQGGTAMVNETATAVSGSALRSALENAEQASDEQLYVYLEEVPKIVASVFSQQAYSTLNNCGGSPGCSWTVGVS